MEVALIPPIEYVGSTHLTSIQLVLPELLGDYGYRKVMEEHLSNPNQYVILDNGAAEGKQPTSEELVAIVEDLYPQELAIPDVLADSLMTATYAVEFLERYHDFFDDAPTRLGLVTQGTNSFEATMTVHAVMESPYAHLIEVLYIPRLLVAHSEDPLVRIKLANHFRRVFPNVKIHLFGAVAAFPKEVKLAAVAGSIRSIDTSLPFSSACYGQSLRNGAAVGRPENYFDSVFDEEQSAIAEDNVNCYLEWAQES